VLALRARGAGQEREQQNREGADRTAHGCED
jgi:hypothetical protein